MEKLKQNIKNYQLNSKSTYVKYEIDEYSQYQNYLYKRALYGLSALTEKELGTMCSKKKQRITNVYKRAQLVLNVIKQKVTIKYTNDINKWKIIFEPKILSIKDENINENMNENFITFKNSTKNRKKNISNKSISYDTEDEYDDNITKDINKFNDEICYLKL